MIFRFVTAALALAGSTLASEPGGAVALAIDVSRPGPAIPENYVGLSVSTASISGAKGYVRILTPANTELIALLRQIGVKHLRTILGASSPKVSDPTDPQIDQFFAFAAAAGVPRVIWSLHLYNADLGSVTRWSRNLPMARHIWETPADRARLESFAFDNEPDWLRTIHHADPLIAGYAEPAGHGYIDQWRKLHQAVAAALPGAPFSGPDTGSEYPAPGSIDTSIAGVPFTLRFARDVGPAIQLATQHFYGQADGAMPTLKLAQLCLSADWLTAKYEPMYDHALAGEATWPKTSGGAPLPYRMTESSPLSGGINRGAQCFATALSGLDYFHWWALHGCVGVDPFTRPVQTNAPIYYDGAHYVAEPYAYGMKAFGLGSSGRVIYPEQLGLTRSPADLNVTVYGVVSAHHLYVTVINKTFEGGPGGPRPITVNLPRPAGFATTGAAYIVLSGGARPGGAGDATAPGACLGGATLPNDGSEWAGRWSPLGVADGGVTISVAATAAVVIDLKGSPTAE